MVTLWEILMLDKYYFKESTSLPGEFTIMERITKDGKSRNSLVCRTPRKDMVSKLLDYLNNYEIFKSLLNNL